MFPGLVSHRSSASDEYCPTAGGGITASPCIAPISSSPVRSFFDMRFVRQAYVWIVDAKQVLSAIRKLTCHRLCSLCGEGEAVYSTECFMLPAIPDDQSLSFRHTIQKSPQVVLIYKFPQGFLHIRVQLHLQQQHSQAGGQW